MLVVLIHKKLLFHLGMNSNFIKSWNACHCPFSELKQWDWFSCWLSWDGNSPGVKDSPVRQILSVGCSPFSVLGRTLDWVGWWASDNASEYRISSCLCSVGLVWTFVFFPGATGNKFQFYEDHKIRKQSLEKKIGFSELKSDLCILGTLLMGEQASFRLTWIGYTRNKYLFALSFIPYMKQ